MVHSYELMKIFSAFKIIKKKKWISFELVLLRPSDWLLLMAFCKEMLFSIDIQGCEIFNQWIKFQLKSKY